MNAAWRHIAQSIFDQPDLEKLSLNELDYLVEEYPYFPVIHLLRTHKLLSEKIPMAESAVARTALYFNNPHWLNHQLFESDIQVHPDEPMAEMLTTASPAESLVTIMQDEIPVPEAELIQEETEMEFDDKRIFSTEKFGESEESPAEKQWPEEMESGNDLTDGDHVVIEETITIDQIESSIEAEHSMVETTASDQIETATEDIFGLVNRYDVAPVAEPGESGSETEITDIVHPPEELAASPHTSGHVEMNISEEPASQEAAPVHGILKFPDEITVVPEEARIAEEAPVSEEARIADEAPVRESLPAVESQAVPEQTQVREENREDASLIPLEPLYSIDYFASQGIKLRLEEEQQTDQLSIKLRSFTQWLKAMKKIHPEKLDQKMDQEAEKHIREYAETSNEQTDLVTEALAEVYLKQGLHQKAASVFEKLSLLDPSKSAYFAARIREIKEN